MYGVILLHKHYIKFITIKDIDKDTNIIKIKSEMKRCEQGNDYLNILADKL